LTDYGNSNIIIAGHVRLRRLCLTFTLGRERIRSIKTVTIITLVIGFAASLSSHAGEPLSPSLDRGKREAIIAAATQAIQKHMKGNQQERKGTEISKDLWGEAIADLKPLRVRDDKVNVFIVLKEDESAEEGLYVSIPISSYAPGTDKRFLLFEKLTQAGDRGFGEIYQCKLRKAQPGGPANGRQPIRSETNRTSGAAGSRR
jgi:hypothetical protein